MTGAEIRGQVGPGATGAAPAPGACTPAVGCRRRGAQPCTRPPAIRSAPRILARRRRRTFAGAPALAAWATAALALDAAPGWITCVVIVCDRGRLAAADATDPVTG